MEGKRKKKERKKKNNAKFSGHYVRQRTHNVHAHALRSDQYPLKDRHGMPGLGIELIHISGVVMSNESFMYSVFMVFRKCLA